MNMIIQDALIALGEDRVHDIQERLAIQFSELDDIAYSKMLEHELKKAIVLARNDE